MLCLYHFNSSFFKWNTFLNYNYSNVITSKRSFWPLNIHFPSFWSNNWSNFLIIAKTSNQDSITDWIRNFSIPLEIFQTIFGRNLRHAGQKRWKKAWRWKCLRQIMASDVDDNIKIGHRNLTLVINIKHLHFPSPTSIIPNIRPRQW